MQKVTFHWQDRRFAFKQTKKLKSFIESIFETEGKHLDCLSYIFCSDKFLLNINKQYLQHDDYTDIITFDLSETKKEIIGEIYISVDRVKENAAKFETSQAQEMNRVLFHGALHLCGYRDKKTTEIKQIRSKEDYYLTHFN
jgi:rRNA maturation RNase YbeY